MRQYLGLTDGEPVTDEHLAAALTAGLTPAKARRAAQRLQLSPQDNGEQAEEEPARSSSKETAAAWHGRMVVKAALERGGWVELQALLARFRAGFVHDLQPRHLPPAWSVYHRCEGVF